MKRCRLDSDERFEGVSRDGADGLVSDNCDSCGSFCGRVYGCYPYDSISMMAFTDGATEMMMSAGSMVGERMIQILDSNWAAFS